MDIFPRNIDGTIEGNTEALKQISRIRDDDIIDRNNFTSVFISGRKVGKVPTSSTDVSADDTIGDVNFQSDYMYVLVSAGSVNRWRRVALTTW